MVAEHKASLRGRPRGRLSAAQRLGVGVRPFGKSRLLMGADDGALNVMLLPILLMGGLALFLHLTQGSDISS